MTHYTNTDGWIILISKEFYPIGKQKVPLRKPFLQNFGTNCREYVSFITMILMFSNIRSDIIYRTHLNNSSLWVIMKTIFINPLSYVALGNWVISNWSSNIIIILISFRLFCYRHLFSVCECLLLVVVRCQIHGRGMGHFFATPVPCVLVVDDVIHLSDHFSF